MTVAENRRPRVSPRPKRRPRALLPVPPAGPRARRMLIILMDVDKPRDWLTGYTLRHQYLRSRAMDFENLHEERP
jgi:hypothetical protein